MPILMSSFAVLSALPCSTNLACSLNGVCAGGTCKCDKPWKDAHTEACAVLRESPIFAGEDFHFRNDIGVPLLPLRAPAAALAQLQHGRTDSALSISQ